MKDFPLTPLLTAFSLTATREAINDIFAHINKKLRISPYPIARALLLAQALSAWSENVREFVSVGTLGAR